MGMGKEQIVEEKGEGEGRDKAGTCVTEILQEGEGALGREGKRQPSSSSLFWGDRIFCHQVTAESVIAIVSFEVWGCRRGKVNTRICRGRGPWSVG